MRKLTTLLIFTISLSLNASDKNEVFNDYSSNFKIKKFNPEYHQIDFSGELKAEGEIVFELVPEEGIEHIIYKISFIPTSIVSPPANLKA